MNNSAQHNSQWWATAPNRERQRQHSLPSKADVVIVGGGIAGVTTAYRLTAAGKRVVLLDMAASLGAGETGQTTAHLTQLPDAGVALVRKNFGDDATRAVLGANAFAISAIEELCGHVDADFKRVPAYLYAPDQAGVKTVDGEYEALLALDQHVERSDTAGLPFNIKAALKLPNQARFHPLKYLEGLADLAAKAGTTICLGVRYESMEKQAQSLAVKTSAGVIETGALVFATHTPATMIALQTKQTPQRTYALSARCSKMPDDALYYDTDEPYHYIRRQSDGDEDLLIIGGCDHRAGETRPASEAMTALEKYARHHFDVTEIVNRWSGQVFEPIDGLPFIGLVPGEDHVWAITGMSGQGMTWSTVGAQVCTDAIMGRQNTVAQYLDPSRIKPLAQGADFLHHNKDVSAHLLGDRLKAWIASAHVESGQGKVARHDGHVAALYYDGASVRAVSAVCPHAGCLVQWNGYERSWDCPCHGSRFATDGKLLCGPAVSDLKQLD